MVYEETNSNPAADKCMPRLEQLKWWERWRRCGEEGAEARERRGEQSRAALQIGSHAGSEVSAKFVQKAAINCFNFHLHPNYTNKNDIFFHLPIGIYPFLGPLP